MAWRKSALASMDAAFELDIDVGVLAPKTASPTIGGGGGGGGGGGACETGASLVCEIAPD